MTNHGRRVNGPLYQLREEEDGTRILFLCSTNREPGGPSSGVGATLRIRGQYHVESIDTQTGEGIDPGEKWTDDGWTELPVDLHVADHRLLRLRAADQPKPKPMAVPVQWQEASRIADPVNITLDEPNVLLLDRAAWSLAGGDWQPTDEVLRVDNLVRHAIGLPDRQGDLAQPWAEPDVEPTHQVALRFSIQCDVPVTAPTLALERAAEATIMVNGQAVPASVNGFYVDEDIATVALPDLGVGEHDLIIQWPFRPGYGLEACYLLGDFGVTVAGAHARIVQAPTQLAFDDWTKQGLPFYGGNVTYHCSVTLPDAPVALQVPKAHAPLLAVDVDGQRVGRIIRPPHRLELPRLTGDVQLDLTCFGDRVNTFGALHNCNHQEQWWGPTAYRTRGEHWTDGYVLRHKGIYVAPILVQEVSGRQ